MGMSIGRLDRRIIIMRAEQSDDGLATVSGAPSEVGRRWAMKEDLSDGERLRAAQNGQSLSTRFTVRWDSLTATITGKDRIVCEGRSYEVAGTKEVAGRRVGIEITATATPDRP